jgi:TRAP-type C4-dicarboxylate transport system permease small subunit
MSVQPDDRIAPAAPPPVIARLASALAVGGGLLALAVAILATVSVLGRWLFDAPIDGDFEYVKMATAVTVFMYLPYTQWRRGNIMVDTFTGWLSPRARELIDAFWDLVYAAFAGFTAWCLYFGASDAVRSGETTMQRQIPIWPSIAVSDALAAFLCIVALATAWNLLRARGADRS